jgi:enoyl-CoA hydratase
MELCLTARMMDAREAERAGLVSRVVPLEKLMEEALAVADTIASFSLPVAMMIKESINRAYETSLSEGVLFERRVFQSQFALEDQKERMALRAREQSAPARILCAANCTSGSRPNMDGMQTFH